MNISKSNNNVNLKIKALREAFEEVKGNMTISSASNIKLIKIVEIANNNVILKGKNLIIYDKNVMQNKPYKKIYKEINDFKQKYKEINRIASEELIKENKKLTEIRSELIQELIILYEENRKLKEELKQERKNGA